VNRRFLKCRQAQFFSPTPRNELLDNPTQEAAIGVKLRRPIGGNDQQLSGLTALSDIGQPLQRRDVAPVKVFDNEHQAAASRRGNEDLSGLAHHPLSCGTLQLPLQRVQFGSIDQER
jgi:hypothetical protein